MTVDTQQVLFLSVPATCPLAVNAHFPIPEFWPVTLAAEFVGFLETDQLSAGGMEKIAIVGVMAVHAPSVFFIVFENDVFMEVYQFPALEIDLHICMAHRARINVLAQGRWWNLDIDLFFACCLLEYPVGSDSLVSSQKQETE